MNVNLDVQQLQDKRALPAIYQLSGKELEGGWIVGEMHKSPLDEDDGYSSGSSNAATWRSAFCEEGKFHRRIQAAERAGKERVHPIDLGSAREHALPLVAPVGGSRRESGFQRLHGVQLRPSPPPVRVRAPTKPKSILPTTLPAERGGGSSYSHAVLRLTTTMVLVFAASAHPFVRSLSRFDYGFDFNGNRLAQLEQRSNPATQALGTVEPTSYGYDDDDRLVGFL